MSAPDQHRHSHSQEEVKERGNALARFAVDRRVTISMIAVGLIVLGYVSLTRLPLEFLPSFGANSLWVSVDYESSSPEETERLVVRPLEESLGTIPGITVLTATANANSGNVSIEFNEAADMDLMVVEARDRVDRVRHLLPDDIERINIRRFQSSDIPILQFHLGAPWERERLFDFAEDFVQPRLERLEGVASVDVRGVRRRELRVSMDQRRMAALNVDVRDISTVLSQNNVNVSGGTITDGSRKFIVRTVGEFRRPEEIRETPIGDAGLRLSDVADVTYEFPTQTSFDYLNGEEAVTFRVYKASNANVLDVADGVKAEMAAVASISRYEDIDVRYIQDSSVDVRGGLSQLALAGLFGGGLAMLILLLFLQKVRTTLLVAVAIPLSIVTTFRDHVSGPADGPRRHHSERDQPLRVDGGRRHARRSGNRCHRLDLASFHRVPGRLPDCGDPRRLRGDDADRCRCGDHDVRVPPTRFPRRDDGGLLPHLHRLRVHPERGDRGFPARRAHGRAHDGGRRPPQRATCLFADDASPRPSPRKDHPAHPPASARFARRRDRSAGTGLDPLPEHRAVQLQLDGGTAGHHQRGRAPGLLDGRNPGGDGVGGGAHRRAARRTRDRRRGLRVPPRGRTFAGGYGGGGRRFNLYLVDEMESERSVQEITGEIREMLPTVAGVDFRIAESRGHGPGAAAESAWT